MLYFLFFVLCILILPRRSLVLGEKDVMPAADGSKTDTGIKRNLSYPKLNLEDLNLMDA
jgi:hypothetical protein